MSASTWWRQPWKPTGVVSDTCQVIENFDTPEQSCGKPSVLAYPAMGGGYMAMCEAHAEKHKHYCVTIEAAKRGEQPDWTTAFKRDAP